MLISTKRLNVTLFVWCFNPVPAAISVFSETPCVLYCSLVVCSASEYNHHSVSTSHLTNCSRMVHSSLRSFTLSLKLLPRERGFVHIQAPCIVDRLNSSIASENKQEGFLKCDCVAIPSSRCLTNDRNNHPLSQMFPISKIQKKEVIGRKTSATCSPSIDYHLQGVYRTASMRCSRRRSNTSRF
jgi:hypothetical protein